ncbi:hypothetical protein [Pseudomonas sp. Ps21-P2]|uniref:PP_RS20740 family protein n=1 Tax=Pseudomonas sp. Ps21-P2 TaxID=3080331 RepID=UPI003209F4DF
MSNLFEDDAPIFDLSEVVGAVDPQSVDGIIFRPWHKPRKQFIRDRQWWYHLELLLNRFPIYKNISVIKYFGLPGGDLLDVNFLSKKLLTAFADKRLLVHGFIDNPSDKAQADLRLSELLDRNNVDRQSKVDKYNFNALASLESLATTKVKEHGAYHLINLDFCDCIFKQATFDSMINLFNIQFGSMLDLPWLFCLTTRADKAGIAHDLLARFNKIFQEQLTDDVEFISALEQYRKEIFSLINLKKDITDGPLVGTDLSEVLQACFIYWIICHAHQNEARMEVVSLMKYKVHGGSAFPDMYSYVIRFSKKFVGKPDMLGISKLGLGSSPTISIDQIKADKIRAVRKLSSSLDVDAALSADPAVYALYAGEMKTLLTECGWDTSTYDESVAMA